MATIRLLQATSIELGTDTPVGDTVCHAIKFAQPNGSTTLLVDPKTHLLRRIASSGTDPAKPDVQINRLYEYAPASTNGGLAAANFAWTPPSTATLVSSSVPAVTP